MPRPRGNDWLGDEIKGLKIKGVDCLVSLLESNEIYDLGLIEEKELCLKEGIHFVNFPIKDVSVPNDKQDFIKLVLKLAERLQNSEKLVIHCRMGIGRSSLLASSIMIRLGADSGNIFDKISGHRELEVPDTEAQKAWVLGLTKDIITT